MLRNSPPMQNPKLCAGQASLGLRVALLIGDIHVCVIHSYVLQSCPIIYYWLPSLPPPDPSSGVFTHPDLP